MPENEKPPAMRVDSYFKHNNIASKGEGKKGISTLLQTLENEKIMFFSVLNKLFSDFSLKINI